MGVRGSLFRDRSALFCQLAPPAGPQTCHSGPLTDARTEARHGAGCNTRWRPLDFASGARWAMVRQAFSGSLTADEWAELELLAGLVVE